MAATFRAEVHGATRPRVNLTQLEAFQFDLPSLDAQAAVVEHVGRLFAGIERMAYEAARAHRLTDRLDEAILDKAILDKAF